MRVPIDGTRQVFHDLGLILRRFHQLVSLYVLYFSIGHVRRDSLTC